MMHDSNLNLFSKSCLSRDSRVAIFHVALRVPVVEGGSTSAVEFRAEFDRSLKRLNG